MPDPRALAEATAVRINKLFERSPERLTVTSVDFRIAPQSPRVVVGMMRRVPRTVAW